MKKKCAGNVISMQEPAPDIFDMWVETELAKEAGAGQFVGVFPMGESTLLPRPISICEVDKEKKAIRLVFRVAGKGTGEFSHYKPGRRVMLLGVLGNGYPLSPATGKKILLLGGGIGIPPILQLAKQLRENEINAEITIAVGYRNSDLFLKEDLEQYGKVLVATEDGSIGTKGNVLDAVRENSVEAQIIYACGPLMMLKAIKQYAEEKEILAYISLEERMACGVGACLGCVCKTTKKDAHSHVNNARICTDGPVFEAKEVDI
ncbi:MAG: dihydroorotate dehydrogenase electron transfer subunit [Lachnospiraceae bacterium]|nr:dihydroorotate dehydrogenase electron transfer subunit [Lachnospiraceae bacterium]